LLKKSDVTNGLHIFLSEPWDLKGKFNWRHTEKILFTLARSLAKKQHRLCWHCTWLLKHHSIFCHILSNDVLAFALSEEIFW